jgi:hypothetical protein
MSFSTPRSGRRYAAFLLLRWCISFTRRTKTFYLAFRREGLPNSSTTKDEDSSIMALISIAVPFILCL